VAGVAAGPTVYLSACGQDTAAVAAVVKAQLESQGCVVRHGGAEVRTRSQCARQYGPLLHDCDVFIQLVGIDPGPLLSSDDGDDGLWSLQVWETREAARRRKPARHYLLDDNFCRAMLSATTRPFRLLKKQERHRRILASSPKKVRQVRDADELLRVLPIIRLAGNARENQQVAAVTGVAEGGPETKLEVTEISQNRTTLDIQGLISASLTVSRDAQAVAESYTEEPRALEPVTQSPVKQDPPCMEDAEVSVIENSREIPPLPELPFVPDMRRADDAGAQREREQFMDSPRFAPPGTWLLPAEFGTRTASGESAPGVMVDAVRSEMAPIPALPSLPGAQLVLHPPEVLMLLAPTPASEMAEETPSEIVAKESSAVVPPMGSPASVPGTAGHEKSGSESEQGRPELTRETIAGSKVFSDKQPVPLIKVGSEKIQISFGDDTEIAAREPWRIEIVAQAPMKLELCRAESGQRVSLRASALERRGLPKRGLPDWMLKRSANHTSPSRPTPGRRAFAQPSTGDEATGLADEAEPPFLETLILPNKTSMRRYLHRRFILFSFTDSVSVRRLSEASTRKPFLAIAMGAVGVVLLGLLVKTSAGYLFDSGNPASASEASGSSTELKAPSHLDITVPRHPITEEQIKPVAEKNAAPDPQTNLPAAVASVKAGSTAPSPLSPEIEIKPAVIPARSLDEQQSTLERALEYAILAMRKDDAGAEDYARKNEAIVLELQRGIQELIPIRKGHEFSGSPQSLALLRSLASVHLLGGRQQAARNVLLDLRDMIGATRTESGAEIRLVDHLLRLTDAAAPANSDSSARLVLPLTPGEMASLLTKLGSDPQWDPSSRVAGGAE
ncbi:MAG: hypothetical protein ACAH88_08600, partial [Roseimicrobium sp.]